MPIYEYECARCHKRFELLQRMSDPLVTACPSCGGAVHKQFSVPALQFKGSGFYTTDYARRSGGSVSTGGASSTGSVKASAPAEPKKASGGSND